MSFGPMRPVEKRGEGPVVPVPTGGTRAMRGNLLSDRPSYVRLSDLFIKQPPTDGPPPRPQDK
jgi:hypothetical protein